MTENKNVNNQDDALKDTVNPDMENKQEPVDEQPKQEEAAEAKEAKGDNVSEKKSKRFNYSRSSTTSASALQRKNLT